MRSFPRQGFTDGFTFAVSPAPKDLRQGNDGHCAIGWSKKLILNREPPMSAVGQKRAISSGRAMSALPPKADIDECDWHVRFVPKADILHCGRDWRYSMTSLVETCQCLIGWRVRQLERIGNGTTGDLAIVHIETIAQMHVILERPPPSLVGEREDK